jgi:hypothetical protein
MEEYAYEWRLEGIFVMTRMIMMMNLAIRQGHVYYCEDEMKRSYEPCPTVLSCLEY